MNDTFDAWMKRRGWFGSGGMYWTNAADGAKPWWSIVISPNHNNPDQSHIKFHLRWDATTHATLDGFIDNDVINRVTLARRLLAGRISNALGKMLPSME